MRASRARAFCCFCIDASGEPLSKRGYRTWNGEAPLRETLAAALVLQSGWHPWQRLYDPCCGTGTILIEAAFIALGRAPGLTRSFSMEEWPCAPREALDKLRAEARARYEEGRQRPMRMLVIADQHAAVNAFPGLVHTARHTTRVVCTRSRRPNRKGGGAEGVEGEGGEVVTR